MTISHSRNNTAILFSALTFLIVIKYFLTLNTIGPDIFYDELTYTINARSIFDHEPYSDLHYPPLYPFLISFALFSKEHWYNYMIVINILVSSAMIIAVWFLSKRYLPKSLTIAALVISSLWSFHVYYSRLIMSENLYIPLFLFSILILLYKSTKNRISENVINALFGISIALGYLTKYIHLVAIPFLAVLWLVKPFFDEDESKRKIFAVSRLIDLIILCLGFFAIYVPWLIYASSATSSLHKALGSRFVTYGIPDFASIDSLVLWTVFYISYMILALAPYLLFFVIYGYMVSSNKIKIDRQEMFYILMVVLLTCIFLAVSIQHSWRQPYNYPHPKRVMGRYLMPLIPLYFILYLIVLNNIKSAIHRVSPLWIVISLIMCVISVFLSKSLLFGNNDHFYFEFVNGPDVAAYNSWKFTVFIYVVLFGISALFMANRWNMKFSRSSLLIFSLLSVLMIQAYSSYRAYTFYLGKPAWYASHGRAISTFLRSDINIENERVTVVNGVRGLPVIELVGSLKFWFAVPRHSTSISVIPASEYMEDKNSDSSNIYLLSRDNLGLPVFHYSAGNQKYYLYNYRSIEKSGYYSTVVMAGSN